jgi:hypothetical protein
MTTKERKSRLYEIKMHARDVKEGRCQWNLDDEDYEWLLERALKAEEMEESLEKITYQHDALVSRAIAKCALEKVNRD